MSDEPRGGDDNVEEPMLTEEEKARRGEPSTSGQGGDEEPMLPDSEQGRRD